MPELDVRNHCHVAGDFVPHTDQPSVFTRANSSRGGCSPSASRCVLPHFGRFSLWRNIGRRITCETAADYPFRFSRIPTQADFGVGASPVAMPKYICVGLLVGFHTNEGDTVLYWKPTPSSAPERRQHRHRRPHDQRTVFRGDFDHGQLAISSVLVTVYLLPDPRSPAWHLSL